MSAIHPSQMEKPREVVIGDQYDDKKWSPTNAHMSRWPARTGTLRTCSGPDGQEWRDKSLSYPCCDKMTSGKYDGYFGAYWSDCPEHGYRNSCYLCGFERGEVVFTCETCPKEHTCNCLIGPATT